LPVIKADRYRIQQLFQNIIVNAVNYIDKESGLVEVASEEFDDYFVSLLKITVGTAVKETVKYSIRFNPILKVISQRLRISNC
jgi:signal transduction histidine kinase